MNTTSRITVISAAASLLVICPGCTATKDTSTSGNPTRLTGSVDGLGFGARVSAIAGTLWGADDGLDIVVTDADDPCDALIGQRRQPNTSVLVLGFLDATGAAKLDTTSVAHSGAYQFVTEPFGPGRWFRVIRAYHLDANCAAAGPADATGGGGELKRDVPLSGGTATGHFSAEFGAGSLSGDFDAPFCASTHRAGCDYYTPGSGPGDELCGFTCGTRSQPDAASTTVEPVDAASVALCSAQCAGTCTADGRCLMTLASNTSPSPIAVDADSVYWAAYDGGVRDAGCTPPTCSNGACTPSSCGFIGTPGIGTVMKIPQAGGTPVTLASSQNVVHDIAVDATNVYWTSDAFSPGPGTGMIMKVSRDGGAPVTLASGQAAPYAIAVDASNAYWTSNNDGTVMKVPLTGGTPVALASVQSSPNIDIAVDSTSVYWASLVDGTVMKVPRDGGASVTLASGQASPFAIAVDSTSVYWTNNGGSIMKVSHDGGTPITLASGPGYPYGIAVDTTSVYWIVDGTVKKAPLGGGATVTLASGQNLPMFIAVDATSVYWTNQGAGTPSTGAVMKLTPK